MRVLLLHRQKPLAASLPCEFRAVRFSGKYYWHPRINGFSSKQKYARSPREQRSLPFGLGGFAAGHVVTMSTTTSASSGNGHSAVRLELTDVEATFRELLLDVASYINPNKPSELRFTGGWVRDKLLGVGSHDIDVAINDMTGYEFGLKMKEYLEQQGHPEKYGLHGVAGSVNDNGATSESRLVHGLHKIEANPEKSKHLETVTTKVFGLDIDLVNLRKETYSDLSRNPQMEFGTPEEDALRRDATVNALFYNLQTQLVEDFTGRGFSDMAKKIIRTPLEPYQTFKDDPLRVLRLIRFASRLDYTIDPASKESMRDQSIKDALNFKISRERIGVEVEKMLKGPNPHMALSLIDELGLYNTIFTDPAAPAAQNFTPDTTAWGSAYDFAWRVLKETESLTRDILVVEPADEYISWLLSAFTPFSDAPSPEPVKGRIAPPLATAAAREGIKATNKVCDIVTASLQNFDEIITIKDKFTRRKQLGHKDVDPAARDTLGMAIRRWGPTWRNQAMFALLIDHTRSTRDVEPEWESFLKHLQTLNILNAYEFKPVLDGKALAKAFDTRPGPWMREALDVVMAWQLLHPDDANIDDAVIAVKDNLDMDRLSKSQGELVADLIHHILTLTIRPLFAKTARAHTDTVTAQGRKVERAKKGGPMPRRYDETEDQSITRPWKDDKHSHALDLLRWVVNHLSPTLTERNWPLLIPPLLTLLDDIETKYKAQGCEFLSGLLKATPPLLLKRTGLADVFEDALKPSLSYLPTLTPEAESVHILNAAYPAFFALTLLQHAPQPQPAPQTATTQQEPFSEQSLALISILHSHIFPSLTHTSPPTAYPSLTAALLTHLSTAITTLGITTVAQLIHLIPLLNSILAAPFATTTPACLRMSITAVKTLQLVVANAWPRMLYWRGEVLDGVVALWLALAQDEADEPVDGRDEETQGLVREARAAMGVCVTMVLRAVEAVAAAGVDDKGDDGKDDVGDGGVPVDFRSELRELADADPKLEGLLGPVLQDDGGLQEAGGA